jgi:hypothetical protein
MSAASDPIHAAVAGDRKGRPVGGAPGGVGQSVHVVNLDYRKLANSVCMGVFAGVSLAVILWGVAAFFLAGVLGTAS